MFRFYKCKDIVHSIVKIQIKTCWHCKIDKPVFFIDECITHALYQVGITLLTMPRLQCQLWLRISTLQRQPTLWIKMRGRTPKGSTISGGPFFSRWSVVVHWPVDMFLLASVRVSTGQWKHVHHKVDDDWSAFIKWLITSRKIVCRWISRNLSKSDT